MPLRHGYIRKAEWSSRRSFLIRRSKTCCRYLLWPQTSDMAARFRLFSRMLSAARSRVFSGRNAASTVKEVESRSAFLQQTKKLEREIKELEGIRRDSLATILAYGVGFGLPIAFLYEKFGVGWYSRAIDRWPALENSYLKEMRNKMLADTKHCRTCSCSCGATL
ncbi:hypothetical protein MKW98_032117 [Papaver atlanticum]|uniref:Uncharacterized protein n=1 Tax=Papaver atlanticum TaxID=357466 RepID=A0AAD4SE99_9MAGN|nr:hypothetical protein MKW98_032117 [Papaver atlanticum]